MSTIVSTLPKALKNVERFSKELRASVELQARLSYARAWYAYRNGGSWCFGPSKFIGYSGMTAGEYVNDEPRDGRQTENRLGQWFTEVPENTPLFEELSEALTAFLAIYDKSPSAKMRINVTNEFYANYITEGSDISNDHAIADLLIAVAKRLPKPQRDRVRASL